MQELKQRFVEIYGGNIDDIRIFTSPGRVNLIGEHTDYNGGFVFPAALTMSSYVAVRKQSSNIIRLAATDLDGIVEADLTRLEEYKNIKWGNYQLGVMNELLKAGYELCGCDMLYHDTIPHGGGLSSSAAIEVATAVAMLSLINASIDMKEIAKISQKAENNYIGVNCGIMDQFASAMGKKNHAIFLDCKDLSYKLIPFNIDGYKIVISNTNKKRSLIVSKYNERRAECEEGLRILQNVIKASCLGEISLKDFNAHKNLIENDTIRKRVEHIITEDDRVLKSIDALKENNLNEFGKLLIKSHESLRDLYEVTGIELDTLVEAALKIDGVLGSRMTGAGFGGCTVSLVKQENVEEFIEKTGKEYELKIGYKASFYVSEIGDGGREIFE